MNEYRNVELDEESSPTTNVMESFVTFDEQTPANAVDIDDINQFAHDSSGKTEALLQVPTSVNSRRQEHNQVRLIDHFSLGNPSSSVRFRNKRVVLYGLDNDVQIVLETSTEVKDPLSETTVTVKRYQTGTMGMRLLRSLYTLVTMLVLGFLVVFCFQIILFLFLNMAASGSDAMATGDMKVEHVCAVIASVPLHLYAMSSILAMGLAVVQDTWTGNQLFQQLLGFSNDVLMESICVVIFLIIPGSTAAITLLKSMGNWWDVTAFTWVFCVLVFMGVFALLVVINEVRACFLLLRTDHPDASTVKIIQEAVLISQTLFYSGKTSHQYLQNGEGERQVLKSQTSIYSKVTVSKLCCKFLFRTLEPPVREYSADELR